MNRRRSKAEACNRVSVFRGVVPNSVERGKSGVATLKYLDERMEEA